MPPLTPSSPTSGPRFLAIARAITDDIRRGVLVPGARLPSSRALARELGVHRNTVLAALDELTAQGWLTTQPARGTYVSSALPPAVAASMTPAQSRAGFALPPPPIAARPTTTVARGVLTLDRGIPDSRGFPVDVLARAWRRVVRRSGRALLSYGPPEGYPGLRAGLADLVRTVRGVPATADHVLVTRGSQMALDLAVRALCRAGDRIAVEDKGYHPAWHALTLAGVELVPIPVDDAGLDVDALARAHAQRPLRAVYTTPHHQYPTTVTLAAGRRLALAALARRHRWVVLEDDYDHEFHYEGRPVTPLAAADSGGNVVYIGTLSKVLAPGLRLGFVVAPPPVIAQLAVWRAAMDRQGDQPMEAAVAELVDDGELERHMRRMRVTYLARRDALVDALIRELGGAVTVTAPRGGISLWARVDPGIDPARWAAACAARGVLIAPGARYTFDGQEPGALRLVFAPHTPAELRRAVAVMAATRAAATSRSPSGSWSRRRAAPSGSSLPRR
jgi:GntR family transcriptional regulator/MocR family aminotransferase